MTLLYMLDTNICIYIAKKRPEAVLKKFEAFKVGQVGMSAITYGELWYGVQKSHHPEKSKKLLEDLASIIIPIPLSVEVGQKYGEIRAILEQSGTPIGNNDLWIAAHALTVRLILVSNNMREFMRVPELVLENWA